MGLSAQDTGGEGAQGEKTISLPSLRIFSLLRASLKWLPGYFFFQWHLGNDSQGIFASKGLLAMAHHCQILHLGQSLELEPTPINTFDPIVEMREKWPRDEFCVTGKGLKPFYINCCLMTY